METSTIITMITIAIGGALFIWIIFKARKDLRENGK